MIEHILHGAKTLMFPLRNALSFSLRLKLKKLFAYCKFSLMRNTKYPFRQKVSFYNKQNLDLNFIMFPTWMSGVIRQVLSEGKRNKNMKKHFINKNLAGFVTFCCLVSYISLLKHCKDI